MWDRLQDFLLQGFLVESECQDDGRQPLLPPQLPPNAAGRHVQVQVVGVEHHGAVQGVDEEPLGRGGCPAATCQRTRLGAVEEISTPSCSRPQGFNHPRRQHLSGLRRGWGWGGLFPGGSAACTLTFASSLLKLRIRFYSFLISHLHCTRAIPGSPQPVTVLLPALLLRSLHTASSSSTCPVLFSLPSPWPCPHPHSSPSRHPTCADSLLILSLLVPPKENLHIFTSASIFPFVLLHHKTSPV